MPLDLKWDESHVLKWIAAQDRCAMQPTIARRVRFHDLLDMFDHLRLAFARLGIGLFDLAQNHLLVYAHRNWIHLNKLHSVGVIHSKSVRQFGCHVAEERAVHSPVYFVKDQQVGLLKQSNLIEYARSFVCGSPGVFLVHQRGKALRVGECQSDGIKFQSSFNIPFCNAQELARLG